MAVGSFLALRLREGPGKVIKYNLRGQVELVGDSFGTQETNTANDSTALNTNRVIQFKGVNDLYTLFNGQIWHYTGVGTTGGTWEVVYSLSDPATGTEGTYQAGPFIVYINDQPALACVYYVNNGTTNWRGVTSLDGITWTETGDVPLFQPRTVSPVSTVWAEHTYRNVIYFNVVNNATPQATYLIFFNPESGSLGYINTNGVIENGASTSSAVASFNDKHYILGNREGISSVVLCEIAGGSLTIQGEFSQNQQSTSKFCLFSDENANALYSFTNDNGTTKWVVSKWVPNIDGSFTRSDITSAVLPTSAYGSTSLFVSTGRWVAIYDKVSSSTMLAYARTGIAGAGKWSFYTWNGESTLIGDNGLAQGSGGSGSDAITADDNGSGSRFWRHYDPHAIIEDRYPVAGGERILFRLYSREPSLSVDVELTYSPFSSGLALTRGTLFNNSAGTLNNSIIEGLIADPDGSTLYEVTWYNAADGINLYQPVRRQLNITRA